MFEKLIENLIISASMSQSMTSKQRIKMMQAVNGGPERDPSSKLKMYVAGPMTGHKYFNFPAFDRVSNRLREMGYLVANPADLDRALGFDPCQLPEDTDWKNLSALPYLQKKGMRPEQVMQLDLVAVLECDIVILMLLDGWYFSKGVKAELAVAEWAGKLIWRINPQNCLG